MTNKILTLRAISFLSVLFVFLLSSCVSQKKKGEVSKIGKFYHNTTALYNGYFNANEIMDETLVLLQEQQADNYNTILSIYPESQVEKPEAVAEELNKAIEKVSIVATMHEPSQWVDDCYVLLGKAQYMKQDYETAQETFEYFIEEFDPSNTRRKKRKSKKKKVTKKKKKPTKKKKPGSKKKKKSSKKKKPGTKKRETKEQKEIRLAKEKAAEEKEKAAQKKKEESVEIDRGSGGVFKHQPAFPEGLLWLARTYVEREKYNLVDFYLGKIDDIAEVPKEVLKEVPVVLAYSALDQKKYNEAIAHLGEAIPLEKNKQRRARLIYIQSQLYQKVGQRSEAFTGFNKVIDMKPDFLMEFNAALNMLKSSLETGTQSVAQVESKLEKLLKEEKNANFKDQIYFTLGEINYSQGDTKKAIPNFQKAIKYNINNSAQLTESYYILANIFYKDEDYVLSKNYYDSTSTVIPKSDERYFEVKAFSENLEDIAKNILIIELQDSLIRLAGMTPEQRADIARELKKQELLAAASANFSDDNGGPTDGLRNNMQINRGAISKVNLGGRGGPSPPTFWAYDEDKVQTNKREFERLWGVRKLEDDWRRSNKSSSLTGIDDIQADDDLYLSEDDINDILKDVPLTPNALAQSKSKIREALFELGVLFREKIENYPKSIESLERLQDNYPGSEKEPDALYYLYLSNLDLPDQARAQYYLNQLKTKYPEEKYTLAITDPSYANDLMNERKIQENMYNDTYTKFTRGEFTEVLSMEKNAQDKFNDDNKFGSKYALLSAMSTGKLEGKESYISALKNMIATYPNTPEQTRAKEILRFLKGDQEAFAAIDQNEAVQDFSNDDDKLHYIIVVVRTKEISDLNVAKISISDYNKKYHKVDRLKLSSSVLNKDNNLQVLLLRKFSNKETAMKYYEEVERNKKEFMEPRVSYETYAISQKNFREIMKKKSTKEYEVFFNENYKK